MVSRRVRIYEDRFTHLFEIRALNGRVLESFARHRNALLWAAINGLEVMPSPKGSKLWLFPRTL
jgi:hypothetical protein